MTTPQTALAIDYSTEDPHDLRVRQMLFVPDPRTSNYVFVNRTLTPDKMRQHWKRQATPAEGIDGVEEGGWLHNYLTRHTENNFGVSAIFAIEVTEEEIDQLREDNPARALTMRLERARETYGVKDAMQRPIVKAEESIVHTRERFAEWKDGVLFATGGRSGTVKDEAEAAPAAATILATSGDKVAPNDRVELSDGTVYVARQFGHDKAVSDVTALRAARAQDMPVLLYGTPGTGKTRAFEAAFGDDLITVLGSEDTEAADFVGGYVPLPGGDFEWVDGPLIRAMENGLPFLVDEIGLISPRTLSGTLYPAMDGRKQMLVTANPARGIVKAVEGFVVVAATNPDAPGVRLSEALLSRFSLQAEYSTSMSVMKSLGANEKLLAVARNLATKRRNGEVSWAPEAREILDFMRVEKLLGRETAFRNLIAIAPPDDRDTVEAIVKTTTGIAGLIPLAAGDER